MYKNSILERFSRYERIRVVHTIKYAPGAKRYLESEGIIPCGKTSHGMRIKVMDNVRKYSPVYPLFLSVLKIYKKKKKYKLDTHIPINVSNKTTKLLYKPVLSYKSANHRVK